MIQRFIELGNGYSDIYELFELAESLPDRVETFLAIHSVEEEKAVTSLALIMKKTRQGEFQPIYICLEGIPYSIEKPAKRYRQFAEIAAAQNRNVIELAVKPSKAFYEKALFFQYVASILRLNRLLRPYF